MNTSFPVSNLAKADFKRPPEGVNSSLNLVSSLARRILFRSAESPSPFQPILRASPSSIIDVKTPDSLLERLKDHFTAFQTGSVEDKLLKLTQLKDLLALYSENEGKRLCSVCDFPKKEFLEGLVECLESISSQIPTAAEENVTLLENQLEAVKMGFSLIDVDGYDKGLSQIQENIKSFKDFLDLSHKMSNFKFQNTPSGLIQDSHQLSEWKENLDSFNGMVNPNLFLIACRKLKKLKGEFSSHLKLNAEILLKEAIHLKSLPASHIEDHAIQNLRDMIDLYFEMDQFSLVAEKLLEALNILDIAEDYPCMLRLIQTNNNHFVDLRKELFSLDQSFKQKIGDISSKFSSLISKYTNSRCLVNSKKIDLTSYQQRAVFLLWLDKYRKTLTNREQIKEIDDCKEMIRDLCEDLQKNQEEITQKYTSYFKELSELFHKHNNSFRGFYAFLFSESKKLRLEEGKLLKKERELEKDLLEMKKSCLEEIKEKEKLYLDQRLKKYSGLYRHLISQYEASEFSKNVKKDLKINFNLKEERDCFLKWLEVYAHSQVDEEEKRFVLQCRKDFTSLDQGLSAIVESFKDIIQSKDAEIDNVFVEIQDISSKIDKNMNLLMTSAIVEDVRLLRLSHNPDLMTYLNHLSVFIKEWSRA